MLISKLSNRVKNMHIANIILIIFAFCMLIPMFVSIFMYVDDVNKNADKLIYSAIADKNDQTQNILDLMIEEIDGIAKIPSYRGDILQILRSSNSENPAEYVTKSRQMANIIGVCVETNNKIMNVTFVTAGGDIFSSFSKPYMDNRERVSEYIRILEENKQNLAVFLPEEIRGIEETEKCIPTIVRILDPHTAITVGYAIVDYKYSALEQLLESHNQVNLYICSDNVSIFNTRQGYMDVNLFDELITLENGQSSQVLRKTADAGEQYWISAWNHQPTGWKIITYLVQNSQADALSIKSNMYIKSVIAVFILAIGLFSYVIVNLMKSINHIKVVMTNTQHGHFATIGMRNAFSREMGELYTSYNGMIEDLQSSVLERYELELEKKKTETRMLLAQIDPHFLYNTLNLTQSVILLGDYETAKVLINTIAEMFRYSSKSAEYITIREEVEHVKKYLTIQMLRYQGKVNAYVYIDPELEEYRIVKFVLQPIVENAFKHGFEGKDDGFEVKIAIKKNNDKMTITIRDNGRGMNQMRLERLKTELKNSIKYNTSDMENLGIGLVNVHKRLHYAYGDAYEMLVKSKENIGTVVTICLEVSKMGGI